MEMSSESSSDEGNLSEITSEGESDSEKEPTIYDKETFHKDLGEIPFEELDNMRTEIGVKRYIELVSTLDKKIPSCTKKKSTTAQRVTQKQVGKKSKNSPLEVSSKVKVPRLRKVVPSKRKLTRDPRFDDLSGTLNEDMFDKSYSFISEMRTKERKEITKQFKMEKDSEKKQEIGKLLQRLDQQDARNKQQKDRKEREKNRRKEEVNLIKDGKRPFYLKNSEKKKIELMEKFKTLKKSGKLDKYLSKKRKRNAAKERRKLPPKER